MNSCPVCGKIPYIFRFGNRVIIRCIQDVEDHWIEISQPYAPIENASIILAEGKSGRHFDREVLRVSEKYIPILVTRWNDMARGVRQ